MQKMERLAEVFHRKADLRLAWIAQTEKVLASEDFGFDVAAVEAAQSQHEAIVSDILGHEDRIEVVIQLADELDVGRYRDEVQDTKLTSTASSYFFLFLYHFVSLYHFFLSITLFLFPSLLSFSLFLYLFHYYSKDWSRPRQSTLRAAGARF